MSEHRALLSVIAKWHFPNQAVEHPRKKVKLDASTGTCREQLPNQGSESSLTVLWCKLKGPHSLPCSKSKLGLLNGKAQLFLKRASPSCHSKGAAQATNSSSLRWQTSRAGRMGMGGEPPPAHQPMNKTFLHRQQICLRVFPILSSCLSPEISLPQFCWMPNHLIQ